VDAERRTVTVLFADGVGSTRTGTPFFVGWAPRVLAEVTWQADPTPAGMTEAAAHFERGIAVLTESGAENELALARTGYGRLCHHLGRTDEARDHLTWALRTFERLGTLREPDRVREALRELE